MSDYGVQVANQNGILVELTDRPVMVLDLIHVPYGDNGMRRFDMPVSGISVDCDYSLEPSSDGKIIKVTHSENLVSWHWENAKSIAPSDAKIIIFS